MFLASSVCGRTNQTSLCGFGFRPSSTSCLLLAPPRTTTVKLVLTEPVCPDRTDTEEPSEGPDSLLPVSGSSVFSGSLQVNKSLQEVHSDLNARKNKKHLERFESETLFPQFLSLSYDVEDTFSAGGQQAVSSALS